MGFFSSSKDKEELALVFDIASGSVGGALFKMQKSGVPKIIFSMREPIVFEEKIDFNRFLSATLKSLEVVASKIHIKGLGAPDRIFCVLFSPWHASQSRVIRLEKESDFVFTSKLADSLIQKETDIFQEELLAKYGELENKVRPIEFKNMKTTLNGYAAPNPINQRAKELEMTIFISMSPEQVLGSIEEAIGRHFHSKIRFSSFTMAAFTVVRDMFVYKDNFLLIQISGEVTDISMVKKDILCESISFPMGRNFMIRGVAAALSCSLDEARSLIYLYKDGHADGPTEKRLKPIIDKLKSEWLKSFQESLINLSSDISIPSTIFITVDKDLAPFFSEIIKTEQFNQYSLTDSKFQVIFLGVEALHGTALFEENIIRDPFLIIESIYINRFLL